MMRARFLLPLFALLINCAAARAADAPACNTPNHRAFDFWIGEWQVHTPDGKLAGTNRIERKHDGCVLHEQYTTDRSYSGESLNIYDASRGVWHQTWVDTSGLLLMLEGGIRDGKMVMEGSTTGANDKLTRHRITWTPNADGTLRQLWESTDADGKWGVLFDGKYSKKSD
jgi:hypothetical protein